MIRISRFGLICASWLLAFQVCGRFLYPFGDEPDFIARAPGLIFGEHSWVNPYYWLEGLLEKLNYSPTCYVEATPFSLFARIDSLSCSETLNQIIARIVITLVVCAPLIFLVVIVRKGNRKASGRAIFNYGGQRVEALALSLLVSGVAYSLGVLAEEQLVLVLSLLIVMVDRRWLSTALLLAGILSLDFGNGVVVTAVVFILHSYRYFSKILHVRLMLLLAIVQAAVALVAGIAFIGFLSNISFLADKADAIYSAVSGSDLVEKYPVYLRPIVTFMTGVFMTPSFVKVVPAFAFVGFSLLVVVQRLTKVYAACEAEKVNGQYIEDGQRERIIDCFAVISTVLLFIFLIPTYSNAKYYLFVIPFLMRSALLVMEKRQILLLLISTQVIIFFGLIFYRI